MTKNIKVVDFNLDRTLLDANFEGYKLSTSTCPAYSATIPQKVLNVSPSSEQWSFQLQRLFGRHNHLQLDPWTINDNNRRVYFVASDLSVMQSGIDKDSPQQPTCTKVAQIPVPDNYESRNDKYNVSLCFASPELAIVADGCGHAFIFRRNDPEWKFVQQFDNLCNGVGFEIIDARMDASSSIHLLLQYVSENQATVNEKGVAGKAMFVTMLEWITLRQESDTTMNWLIIRTRRLSTFGNLDYSAFSTQCDSLCTLSSQPVRFVFDSVKPVAAEPDSDGNVQDKSPVYSWGQTAEDVCIIFSVGTQTTKNDIDCRITSKALRAALKANENRSEVVLIDGELHLDVDLDGSTWTIEQGRLEITLHKRDNQRMWTEVVMGDSRGEYVVDPSVAREISERLKPFTVEGEQTDEDGRKAPFNIQQLEECDAAETDSGYLTWLDGEEHCTIAETNIGGHQWLFNVRLDNGIPFLCLRHDVDGILWQIDGLHRDPYWIHYKTFNAFGYVQAGKPQRNFCICSLDGSYSAVVDCTRHSYVYWQPENVDGDLRNRKTGQKVPKVSKQNLISVCSDGGNVSSQQILGAVALENALLLLTEDRLISTVLKE